MIISSDLTPTCKCNSKSAYRLCLRVMHEQGKPRPRQVPSHIKVILQEIWKNKHMPHRFQTVGWWIIRRVVPTGKRADRFFKHINKYCSRCNEEEEDDSHLFFYCTFARASWFAQPWCIRIMYCSKSWSHPNSCFHKPPSRSTREHSDFHVVFMEI